MNHIVRDFASKGAVSRFEIRDLRSRTKTGQGSRLSPSQCKSTANEGSRRVDDIACACLHT